jgi:hypothetical protein
MDKKFWFKNKRYGWGWTPTSVEGWLITTVYFLVAMSYPFLAKLGVVDFSFWIFFLVMIVSTTAFIFICYKKGEKPKWRWGADK